MGVICSILLAKTLRRNKSLREARRWQLRQNLGLIVDTNVNSSKNLQNDYQIIGKKSEAKETKDVEQAIFTGSPSVN